MTSGWRSGGLPGENKAVLRVQPFTPLSGRDIDGMGAKGGALLELATPEVLVRNVQSAPAILDRSA
jgi:hypothetical protein